MRETRINVRPIFDQLVGQLGAVMAQTSGTKSNCIAATRIAIEILDCYGIRAWAQPVRMYILNPRATKRYLRGYGNPLDGSIGCKGVGTEQGGGPIIDATGYNAHLVVATEHGFLDITLDQFSTPEFGVRLDPMWVEGQSLSDGRQLKKEINRCLVVWTPISDETYMHLPAWTQGASVAGRCLVKALSRRFAQALSDQRSEVGLL